MDARILAAVAGNTDALAALLTEHHDSLLTLLNRKVSYNPCHGVDAEDVLQQVYIEAFQSIRKFEPRSDQAFHSWLETIAERRLIDVVRMSRTQKRGGEAHRVVNEPAASAASYFNLLEQVAADLTTPSGVMARNEGLIVLRLQLSQLPDDQRQAVELRHLEGLSREEIAVRMGRTGDEVRGLIYRGMEQLRDRMGSVSEYLSRRA